MTSIISDSNHIHNTPLEQQRNEKYLGFLTPIFHINSEESLARNRKFLKDLELAKARLRTYAAYTPTDRELQQRAMEYRKYLQKYIQNFTS
ncbi:hypothetical protein WN48_04581 [Eufriesea mexicana]|uniref:uncharacterized protein LOC108555764 n=1 Tax=Eufriesea mexicana TaxID=516756 RepID=UPI00083C37F4|nr:PREDICTED: uncharacterized protein LOC108555764 [Eufriesea mexicana]OAD60814.1 hypothetical protein WN48_04581 [Eufriesea mexicana]